MHGRDVTFGSDWPDHEPCPKTSELVFNVRAPVSFWVTWRPLFTVHSVAGRAMRLPWMTSHCWIGAVRLGWTALLGLLVVTAILPLNGLALVLWVVTIVRPLARSLSNTELTLNVSAMAGIVVAAMYCPGKVTERVLDRQVVLPKTVMSLGELRDWTESPESRAHLPIRTWFIVHDSEVARVVHWPRLVLSLRDFVSTIEVQTRIRHQFHGCGNGWTVLWGNDCSFGLALRDPARAFP
jgi:hypothetical protein